MSIVEQGGAFMDITRVSAVYPVISAKRLSSKDSKEEAQGRERKKDKEFAKILKTKSREGNVIDARR